MADQVLLYISAAADLMVEREVLARSVVEIPVTLGWRIVQSPGPDAPVDLQAVTHADLHVVLLGGDIRAPIGQEWSAARRAGRRPLLYLKHDIRRTPAAQNFVRFVEQHEAWETYADASDLRRKVMLRLADHLADEALHYALMPGELERLQAWRATLETPKAVDTETRGGAGASSVILSKERFVPSEGVLIRPRTDEGPE